MRILLTVLLLGSASSLTAHPHLFITTGLIFETDAEGALTGIAVQWRYDELYSLQILTDMGLDPDFDGELTEVELDELAGFDLNWVEGFNGDLHVTQDGEPITLGAPEYRGIAVENGQIVSGHVRPVSGVDGPFLVRVFDQSFYTAYDLGDGVYVEDGCAASVEAADIEAAQEELQEILLSEPAGDDDDFPEVGALFADHIEVTCGQFS